jgi:hypothetical protein
MKRRIFFLLLILMLALAGTAAELTWTPIHWESAKIGDRTVQRAALLVPVQLDGKSDRVLVQLDLGTGLTQFDSAAYEQLFGKGTAPKDRPKTLPFSGVFGGSRVKDYPMHVVPQTHPPEPADRPILLGTLGADFFNKRILVLDFVRQRICILDEGTALSPNLEKQASFVQLTIRDGNLVVPLTVNGKTETDFFYDTGASLFPIATTAARWKALAGRTGKESDNQVWKVNSWGKEAVMVGAPIAGALQVGTARLEHPLVFFESSGIPNLADVNLFGNALFFDRFTVIVDIPGKRFGLIPTHP